MPAYRWLYESLRGEIFGGRLRPGMRAERWIGSCRGELLDHVIVVNERHLKRLISVYLHYYH
jgi:hypothetical protein